MTLVVPACAVMTRPRVLSSLGVLPLELWCLLALHVVRQVRLDQMITWLVAPPLYFSLVCFKHPAMFIRMLVHIIHLVWVVRPCVINIVTFFRFAPPHVQ